MTAPAVVRRWEQGAPAPAGRPAKGGGPPVERRRDEDSAPVERRRGEGRAPVERWRGEGRARAAARDQLARLRRAAPLSAALVTAVAAHAGLAPHLALGGLAPDVLLVAVAAVAAGRGARAGAGFGFAAGLAADLFLATPLGTSALAYTLVGHVVGRSRRSRPPNSAAALCSPTSTCFACRTGRRHAAGPDDSPSPGGQASRPVRQQRRAMVRRATLRRSLALAFFAVAAGRAGTAMVATALGGIPFPKTAGLLHILGVAIVSAPLGIPAVAAGRPAGREMGARR